MAPNFRFATVVSHQIPATTFHDIVFQTEEEIKFEPGQYLTCKVAENRLNSYSIAGKLPNNQFGFIVDSKPGGPGSHYFESLKPGDRMQYLGPFGKFVLKPDDGSEHLVFLGTGTGVAPLKAMIEAGLREHHMTVPMTLYFGLRYKEDIYWEGYFHELEAQYPNFKLKLCLSKPSADWTGPSGHITDCFKDDFPDMSKFSAYLCGGLKMIEEAVGILKDLKMPEERIYHEKFF